MGGRGPRWRPGRAAAAAPELHPPAAAPARLTRRRQEAPRGLRGHPGERRAVPAGARQPRDALGAGSSVRPCPRAPGAPARARLAARAAASAERPRLALLLAHARPRLTFSHTRSRTLRVPSASTDQRRHTTAGSFSERGGGRAGGRARNTAATVVKTSRSLALTPPHPRAPQEVAATPSDAGTRKRLAQRRCGAADRFTTWTNPVGGPARNYKAQNTRVAAVVASPSTPRIQSVA